MQADWLRNRDFLVDWPGQWDKALKQGLSWLKWDVWYAYSFDSQKNKFCSPFCTVYWSKNDWDWSSVFLSYQLPFSLWFLDQFFILELCWKFFKSCKDTNILSFNCLLPQFNRIERDLTGSTIKKFAVTCILVMILFKRTPENKVAMGTSVE